jgi:cell division protein FtsN
MEQKKLLWIIFSVALFLLIVVGIGLIWLYPGSRDQPVVADEGVSSREAGADFDPVEWVRSENEIKGLEEEEVEVEDENFVVVYGDPGEKQAEDTPKVESDDSGDADGAVRDTTSPPSVTTRVPEKETPAPPAKPSTPRPVEQDRPPVTRTVGVTEYWIQTGSYTSRTRADTIKRELDELGLSGRILSKEIDGTQYYRVRIGPYGEKAEADKFLDWVKQREQFRQSYISQVYRNKTVVQ